MPVALIHGVRGIEDVGGIRQGGEVGVAWFAIVLEFLGVVCQYGGSVKLW